MVPTTIDTAPAGTQMNAVHQTARPTPIAITPPASHGQASLTEEGYPAGWMKQAPPREPGHASAAYILLLHDPDAWS
jgi:hypothetical protein